MTPIIELRAVRKVFPVSGRSETTEAGTRVVVALDNVSLGLHSAEILGLAGESGSGKTTLAELVLNLQTPTHGEVRYQGVDLETLSGTASHEFRRHVQMIFQDPYESINPRFSVRRWVEEPLIIHGFGDRQERLERVSQALAHVELRPPEAFLDSFPHQLSGGQRQRLSIARALILEPKILIADEPVSMLDVSVRGGILRLLRRLRETLGLAILYISHDLSTVRQITDRVAILYRGAIVEMGDTDHVMQNPLHPYTRALIAAVPTLEVGEELRHRRPLPLNTRPHQAADRRCRFALNCPLVMGSCWQEPPELVEIDPGHVVSCFLYPHPVQKSSPRVGPHAPAT